MSITSTCLSSDSGTKVWKPSSRPRWPGSIRSRRRSAARRRPVRANPSAIESERGQEIRPGLRTGKVIGVRGKSIFVDLGGKSEGVLPVDAVRGRFAAARFDDRGRRRTASIRKKACSGPRAAKVRRSTPTGRPSAKGVIVEARVTKAVKGGLEVDVDGIRGFLPISQIDLSRVEDAASYINQKFKALVTEANQREKNLVVSRRELLEQERAELREQHLGVARGRAGARGVVRSIKGFGAFVDIGGVDGLLPIGEMSWGRVSKADDLLKDGRPGQGQGAQDRPHDPQAHARA